MTTNTFFLALISGTVTQPAVASTGSLKLQSLRNLYQAIDSGDIDRALQLIASDGRIELPVAPEPLDCTAYAETVKLFCLAFPDMRHEVVSSIEEGNRISINGLFTGTNSGPFNGMPASHRHVSLEFTAAAEFNTGGLISKMAVQFDVPAFMAALQPA